MIIVLSDTLHYRPDGTVSGVTRVARESYTTPGGRELYEDVSSTVGIEVVTALLDGGYAAFHAHNKALEKQIDEERTAARDDKALALQQLTDAYAADRKRLVESHEAAIAAKDEALSQKEQEIATERAKTQAALEAVEAARDAERLKQ